MGDYELFLDRDCTEHIDEQAAPTIYMRLNTAIDSNKCLMAPDDDTAKVAGSISNNHVVYGHNDCKYEGVVLGGVQAGAVIQLDYSSETTIGNNSYYGYYGLPEVDDLQIFNDVNCTARPSGYTPDTVYVRFNSEPYQGDNTDYTDGNNVVASCSYTREHTYQITWQPSSNIRYSANVQAVPEGKVITLSLQTGTQLLTISRYDLRIQ